MQANCLLPYLGAAVRRRGRHCVPGVGRGAFRDRPAPLRRRWPPEPSSPCRRPPPSRAGLGRAPRRWTSACSGVRRQPLQRDGEVFGTELEHVVDPDPLETLGEPEARGRIPVHDLFEHHLSRHERQVVAQTEMRAQPEGQTLRRVGAVQAGSCRGRGRPNRPGSPPRCSRAPSRPCAPGTRRPRCRSWRDGT